MSPNYFDKVKFESKISPDITQHLKVKFTILIIKTQIWKFTEDKRKFENVRSSPVQLNNLKETGFYFSSSEAYLLLLIYRSGTEGILKSLILQQPVTWLPSPTVYGEQFNLQRI